MRLTRTFALPPEFDPRGEPFGRVIGNRLDIGSFELSPELPDVIPGDSNHRGIFNSSDFVVALTAGEYEDYTVRNSTFEEGGWNGDGDFNSTDFAFIFMSRTCQRNAPPRFGSLMSDDELERV